MTAFTETLVRRRDELKNEFARYSLKTEAFATDAIRFCAASRRAQEDLKTRSLLRRSIGIFTGANNRLRDISQEDLAKSLEATHEVLRGFGKEIRLLSDGLYVTQQGLAELTRQHDDFAESVVALFETIAEKLDQLERDVGGHSKELERLGVSMDMLKEQVGLLNWKNSLLGGREMPHRMQPLRRLIWLATGFIRAKRICWTENDLNIFVDALKDPHVGDFRQSQPSASFLDQAITESREDFSQVGRDLKPFVGKPFHLFSGMTWPVVLLWELIHNREAFDSAADLRKRLLDVHGFEIADELDSRDLAIKLLNGLKPLFQVDRVSELMLGLMADPQMEFADRLSLGNALLGNDDRLCALEYRPDWCDAAWGFKAILIEAPGSLITLHQQYFERKDGPRWRVMLEFSGKYKGMQDLVARSASTEGVGELKLRDGESFEISREFEPRWADWDSQRVDLGNHARRAYDFVAKLPLPSR